MKKIICQHWLASSLGQLLQLVTNRANCEYAPPASIRSVSLDGRDRVSEIIPVLFITSQLCETKDPRNEDGAGKQYKQVEKFGKSTPVCDTRN